jgi:AhpD family alkylhydroperoxidase
MNLSAPQSCGASNFSLSLCVRSVTGVVNFSLFWRTPGKLHYTPQAFHLFRRNYATLRNMLFDWNRYQAELTKCIPEFAKLSPDSLKGYQTLSAANAKNSLLGEKVRQPISLAVAVTTRCAGCITFHTDATLKAGATKQEIAEALGVAMAMNAGAALIYSLRALDSVDAHASQAHPAKP